MLFPQIGPAYLNQEDKNVLDRMEAFYADSLSINQSYWSEADVDARFEAGDQTLWQDLYGNLPVSQRKQFNFNRIKRVVNMISGHQRRNRKSTVVSPVENADEQTADQFSKIIFWVNQKNNVLETISEAFQGALVTGMSLLQLWLDYRSDPISGNIKVENCAYNSFLIDPFFKKPDLSDCNGLWKRTFINKRECISLLPDKEDDIMNLTINYKQDGKFQFMPESYNSNIKDLLTYDEFYYRDYRTQLMLIDSVTGEAMEWSKKKDDPALRSFLNMYPQITLIEQEIPTVRVAIVVQGVVFYNGPNPLGTDSYPFVPVFGYYAPSIPYFPLRVQGVVRGLRDAQYLYNRRKVIELDILESQINSGWKYKEDALVNPKDVFLSGQGKGLALKQEAQMSDAEQIMPPGIHPSMIQLSEILAREIQEISGVNEELLGSAIDEKAGILSMLRQGAGLTTLQNLFDQLDRSQRLLGNLMIDAIQANFTPGKVKKIINQEPGIQFYSKAFGKYDAVVEEGLNTSTQRQMQFAQLLQLREAGVPIPEDALLEAATIQNKKELMDRIAQAKQQEQQIQQLQMQTALQEQQARINLTNARATADEGLGLERLSRIQENKALAVERRAEADKDREMAVLNMVKAIKELDEIDLTQIERIINLIHTIKQNENLGGSPMQTERSAVGS